MVIHNQKLNKIILALRRGLIKVNLLYDPDLFLNNHLSGFRPRRSGVPFSKNYIKLSRLVRFVGIATSTALVLLTLAATFPMVNHQNDAEATYIPATTTLSIVSSKDTASVDITPTSASGTFATSAAADMAEFTVTTDNLTGYSLNILGTDTSGQLVNSTTGDTLDTIAADTTENDFRTGAASTYNNKWGYRLTVNSATTTNFFSAPTSTSTAKTIYTTSAPNTTGTSDSFTLGVGARVDYTKPVGTYTNTFVLTAVANNISYQINYLDADGTTQLLTPDAESDISASSIELNSTTPTKSGYTFLGWCDGTLSSDGTSCAGTPGTTYQPGDTYTFTSFTSGTTTANLYAMWEEDSIYMQNFTMTMCQTLASSGNYTVADQRDNKEYTVRYIDNNCWMTSNLRFTGMSTDVAGTMTLDPTTSDVPSSTTINYYALTTGNYDTRAEIQDDGSLTEGVYYNYPAATAMQVATDSNYVAETTQSVCPAGWRLPSFSDINGILTYKSEFNPVLAGEYWSGSKINYGSYGFWWTSTSGTYTNATNGRYYLSSTSAALSTVKTGNPAEGFSIRCVRKAYLQDFTTDDANAMSVNEQKYLVDKRDNQPYTIAKLQDGNVWMVDNLNIGGSDLVVSELNSSNTNLSSSTSPITASDFLGSGWKKTSASTTLVSPEYIPITVSNSSVGYIIDTTSKTKYGTIYNYCAATAGTYCMASSTTADAEATSDLCPAGWRLPTGGPGSNSDTSKLRSRYSSVISQTSVTAGGPGLSVSGNFYNGGNVKFQNSNGDYWTSTRYSSTNQYYLLTRVNSNIYEDGTGWSRGQGMAIRCIKN